MFFESNLLYRKNHDISLDSTVLFYNPLGFRAAKAQYNGMSSENEKEKTTNKKNQTNEKEKQRTPTNQWKYNANTTFSTKIFYLSGCLIRIIGIPIIHHCTWKTINQVFEPKATHQRLNIGENSEISFIYLLRNVDLPAPLTSSLSIPRSIPF